MDEFIKLISNVGFPIAAYMMMYYMCNTTIKENTKAVNDCTDLIHAIKESRKEVGNV